MRNKTCGELRASAISANVQLCGWVDRRRDHGGVIFIDLRDRSGTIQITVDPDQGDDLFNIAEGLRNETVIQINGLVRARPEEAINTKIPTGEIEVLAKKITILNAVANTLPFSVSVHDEDNIKEEIRLKHRYLDLRRERMNKNLRLRHNTVKVARSFLENEGFIEVETPVLTRSTPEGARDYLVPSRVCGGEFFALPQSPQLFKQLLMVGGIERYYQVARCFRDEDLRADRQPEFTQLDIEMSFMDENEIIQINEQLIVHIWKEIKGINLSTPFPRMTWQEAMDRFGTDRPDTRYGMELVETSDLFSKSGFKVFSNTISSGGCVKCITIKNGNDSISNVRIKPGGDIFSEAQKAGAGGLAFIRVRENEEVDTIGAIKDNLTISQKKELLLKTNANAGDLILFGAGPKNIVNRTLDRIRQFIAKDLELISNSELTNQWDFLWVTDFPMFEFNSEENRLEAIHHPFCSPKSEDIGESKNLWKETLPNSKAQAYDLVLNGLEIGGGSLRIHNSELQKTVLEIIGLSESEVEAQFGFLIDALSMGAPPHGGIAFGLDRIVMLLANEDSIRDTIAFPKTQQARCSMAQAPANVANKQLEDLHIASTWTEPV